MELQVAKFRFFAWQKLMYSSKEDIVDEEGPFLAGIPLVVLLLGEGGFFQEPRSGEAGCHYDSTVRAIRKWQEPSQGSAENAFFYIPLVLILLFTAALEYLGLQRRKPGVDLKRLRTR